ncbi:hypothetical protein HYPSUDRAFT_293799 [Hypholoma sublateritium FD-334 SS-4]|uniref:Uncharacterized protein n=1 Tax=Hypholoma sublateritium (strain FD-334 SS-4) TaxID=945553 RepID=A0A0D2NID1_HYPSF|nr:hypothetical protein HYPSUDRAFT_293799 [Hypholoma sublateritium FD-334 SS-4]
MRSTQNRQNGPASAVYFVLLTQSHIRYVNPSFDSIIPVDTRKKKPVWAHRKVSAPAYARMLRYKGNSEELSLVGPQSLFIYRRAHAFRNSPYLRGEERTMIWHIIVQVSRKRVAQTRSDKTICVFLGSCRAHKVPTACSAVPRRTRTAYLGLPRFLGA